MATLNQAGKALKQFRDKQKQLGIVEQGNVLQQKWDMKDVMEDVPPEHFPKLLRFFLDVDEDKTLTKFFRSYHEYYRVMLETIAERRRSRAAVRKTMENLSEQ